MLNKHMEDGYQLCHTASKVSYTEDDTKFLSSNNYLESEEGNLPHYSKWNITKKIYDNDDSGSVCVKTGLVIVEKSPKDRYGRFAEEIGKGSFKTIYKAYDYDEGKEVAWNVINTLDKNEEELNHVYDEINLLKMIKNEYIIKYLNGWFDSEKNHVVLISELFTGGSLLQFLKKTKYPRLKVVKNWAREILQGLKYLHEFNPPIIHRDIKCDNIFINCNDGVIKIGDLGLSCLLNNDEQAHTFSGTPEFMAPEIFKGDYGVKADIYSFGLCVLEMITFEKPYKECSNLMDVFEKIQNNTYPKSLSVILNHNVVDFIKMCLIINVEERPTAEELLKSDFLNDLENDENNHPVPLSTKEFKDYELTIANDSVNNSPSKKKESSPFKSSPYRSPKKKSHHKSKKHKSQNIMPFVSITDQLINDFYKEKDKVNPLPDHYQCYSCNRKSILTGNKIEFQLSPRRIKSVLNVRPIIKCKKLSDPRFSLFQKSANLITECKSSLGLNQPGENNILIIDNTGEVSNIDNQDRISSPLDSSTPSVSPFNKESNVSINTKPYSFNNSNFNVDNGGFPQGKNLRHHSQNVMHCSDSSDDELLKSKNIHSNYSSNDKLHNCIDNNKNGKIKSGNFNLHIIEEESGNDDLVVDLLKKITETNKSILKIKFNYNLRSDTCEGIASELKSVISLKDEEENELKILLHDLGIHYLVNLFKIVNKHLSKSKNIKKGKSVKIKHSEDKHTHFQNHENEDKAYKQNILEYEKYLNEGRLLLEKLNKSNKKTYKYVDKIKKLSDFLQNECD